MLSDNKIIPIVIIFIALFSVGFFIYDYVQINENQNQGLNDRNYKAEVLLKASPNMDSRMPTDKDIDTKLNLQTKEGDVYRLFESRDFVTYGKTFVVRIK
jgi:hypothetical protein